MKLYSCAKFEITFFTVNAIKGGMEVVDDEKYPFMVSLQVVGDSKNISEHFCGGSVISDRFILTAAHCIQSFK